LEIVVDRPRSTTPPIETRPVPPLPICCEAKPANLLSTACDTEKLPGPLPIPIATDWVSGARSSEDDGPPVIEPAAPFSDSLSERIWSWVLATAIVPAAP